MHGFYRDHIIYKSQNQFLREIHAKLILNRTETTDLRVKFGEIF